jgi:hypothetical protein
MNYHEILGRCRTLEIGALPFTPLYDFALETVDKKLKDQGKDPRAGEKH